MSKILNWTARTFEFKFPAEVYPEMIERVRGTPARLEDRVALLGAAILTKRDNDKWSIQENAGHLLDLESLFAQRLDEYLAGAKELHAADMSNRKTYDANHNDVPIEKILAAFREQRMQLANRLDDLTPDVFKHSCTSSAFRDRNASG